MFNAADDYDLWLRLSETGKLANIPDVLYMYRINPSGISMANAVSQGVGVCAARWASRARRTGRPDPIAKHDKITLEWMMERGLMAGWCYREIAKKLISSTAQTQHYGGPWTMVTARLEEARDWIYTHRVYTQFLPLWYYTVLIRQQHGVALTTAEKIWLRLLQFCRSAYRLLKP